MDSRLRDWHEEAHRKVNRRNFLFHIMPYNLRHNGSKYLFPVNLDRFFISFAIWKKVRKGYLFRFNGHVSWATQDIALARQIQRPGFLIVKDGVEFFKPL